MGKTVAVKVTPEGVLVPHRLVEAWGDVREVEIEQRANTLIIKPRTDPEGRLHDRIVGDMKAVGLIEDLDWALPPAISCEERARLAEKLGRGKPLSELILEDREEYA